MQRKIKNVVKNYTPSEIKVREATSNDPWGPSSILMSEIATLTFDALARAEIMPIIWKRLNDHGKNWRHVYKSLVLLEYLVRTGSDQVVRQCKDNIILIQTLREFQYVENGLDCGLNVREAAKSLFDLLKDEEKLKNERSRAAGSKARFGDMWSHPSSAGELATSSSSYNSERKYKPFTSDAVEIERHSDRVHSPVGATGRTRQTKPLKDPEVVSTRPSNHNEEELQLQLALAMSKEEHEAEMRKRKGEEIKLQMAIEESKKTAEQEKLWRKTSPLDLDKRQEHRASSDALADPWGGQGVRDPWKSRHGDVDVFSSISKSNDDLFATPLYSTVQKSTASNLHTAPWEELSAKFSQPPSSSSDDFLEISNRHATVSTTNAIFHGKLDQPKSPATDGWFSSSNASTGAKLENLLEDLWGGRGATSAPDGANGGVDGEDGGDLLKLTADGQMKNKGLKKITPEEFLGPNAKLVDLNELVSKPKQSDCWNPFSMTTQIKGPVVNPFVAKAQQEEKSKRVPLNQLQSSGGIPSSQLGQSFNFEGSSFGQSQPGIVQSNQLSSFSTPALALMYTPQPIAQNQNYNPFM